MTGCAFLLAAAAAVGSLAPVSESRWTVKTYGQDDAVALGRSGGVLTVDWSILPKTPRISGCFRYTGGWADILLDNPIALLDECERVVFERLDWTVRAGERWLVAGPNGSGKTTLLAFVIGDHPQAYANDVRLFGVRRGTGESIWSIKRRIGWV